MAAILVIAIAFPPLFFALTDAHRSRVEPIQVSKARWLAAEKIEDVLADRHSSTRGYSYVSSGSYPAENPVTGHAGFSRSVSVSETRSRVADERSRHAESVPPPPPEQRSITRSVRVASSTAASFGATPA